jgi:hypothetical protein
VTAKPSLVALACALKNAAAAAAASEKGGKEKVRS